MKLQHATAYALIDGATILRGGFFVKEKSRCAGFVVVYALGVDS